MWEYAVKNNVLISGEITKEFEFSHEVFGEKFYTTILSVERNSGLEDLIPIMVSDRLVSVKDVWTGNFVRIRGQFRSYNKKEDEKSRLILSVFVTDLEVLDFIFCMNEISIDGFVCKMPVYRNTPLGREIADVLIAANRPYGKSDYIPCIFWGRNARFISSVEPGQRIEIYGRIQSREYFKNMKDGTKETRIAYEVSVSKFFLKEKGE